MNWNKMRAITMPFKQPVMDVEGNTVTDSKTGRVKMQTVELVVRHSPFYYFK